MTTTFTKTNILKRVTPTLLALIISCATAWAQTPNTYYIDKNGVRTEVEAIVLDGNGNLIVNGGGIVQIIDMMGRVIVERRDGACTVSTANIAPGVYVLRLIDGDNVKTQKIVIK